MRWLLLDFALGAAVGLAVMWVSPPTAELYVYPPWLSHGLAVVATTAAIHLGFLVADEAHRWR